MNAYRQFLADQIIAAFNAHGPGSRELFRAIERAKAFFVTCA